MAAFEMNHFRDAWQQAVIANAKAFAVALHDAGLDVAGDPAVQYTETHQVVVRVGYGQGPEVAGRLEDSGIIVNYQAAPDEEGFTAAGALRLGVAEMTRFGMGPEQFARGRAADGGGDPRGPRRRRRGPRPARAVHGDGLLLQGSGVRPAGAAAARPDLTMAARMTPSDGAPDRPTAMNNATGKRLLALIRDGDYAHPGEEEANELLFAGVRPDPRRRVLDAGCGGAGTAAWVQARGLGAVTGIEIDAATAALARERHPEVTVVEGDLQRAGAALAGPFDLRLLDDRDLRGARPGGRVPRARRAGCARRRAPPARVCRPSGPLRRGDAREPQPGAGGTRSSRATCRDS